MTRYGTIVASARAAYAETLLPFFHAATEHFLPGQAFELRTSTGWDAGKTLDEALRDSIGLDLRDGYTHAGPQKGDFSIWTEGRAAKFFLSRGQMKLLVFALLLAQAHLLEASLGSQGCVLIDDLASELDSDNRNKLLAFLRQRQSQFFITATDPNVVEQQGSAESAMFHVEHGRVTRV
jgi:DNA replication and repair protein RecF